MARIGKEQKEAIRQNILETSEKMFNEQGYDKTSTSQIAKAVGIAEGTIFNYFKTKSDILIEIFGEKYDGLDDAEIKFDPTDGVVEIYVKFYHRMMSKIILMPKKILIELFLTMGNAAKKKPDLIKRFAKLDFQFLEKLEELTISLQERKLVKSCDAKLLSESIFSIICYEFIMYLYEKEMTKVEMHDTIIRKLNFALEGRISNKE